MEMAENLSWQPAFFPVNEQRALLKRRNATFSGLNLTQRHIRGLF
jgi:hypothetical protein